MKKNDVILVLAVAIYSMMFYHQLPGINFLIFSVLMIIALLEKDRTVLQNQRWLGAAAGTLISGFAVMYFSTGLSIIANLLALSALSAFSVSKKSSIVLGWVYTTYSYITSAAFMFVDWAERKNRKSQEKAGNLWLKIMIGIGIFVILMFFFFLYQKSNPLFKNLTEQINFDWISWEWVRFTLIGFLLLYGFLYHRNFSGLYKLEEKSSENLDKEKITSKENTFFGKIINLKIENSSGLILLALLNFLILTVNILDIAYVWAGAKLPAEMTYSDMVHQGVGNLILSIIIAILVILYLFRGQINYLEKNRGLKILAYLWIIQNVIMIVSSALKNQYYIDAYSLTHKRIGVYVYLLMALIGLVTTLIKIYGKKTNWYLFVKNSWAWFIVLIIGSLFNWDLIITKFNIKHSQRLDVEYLIDLNYSNIPYLLKLNATYGDSLFQFNKISEYNENTHEEAILKQIHHDDFQKLLHHKMYKFLSQVDDKDWRSWSYTKAKTYRQITAEIKVLKIRKLDLSDLNIKELIVPESLKDIDTLIFTRNILENQLALGEFSHLKFLNLNSNSINKINEFPAVQSLEYLDISNNSINEFSGLKGCVNLKTLDISSNGTTDLNSLPKFTNLENLDLSWNQINSFEILKNYKKLKTLKLSSITSPNFSSIPDLPSVTELDISKNNLFDYNLGATTSFKKVSNVQKLNAHSCGITTLLVFTNYYQLPKKKGYLFFEKVGEASPYLPDLKSLNISGNSIENLEPLKYFNKLINLDISENKLKSLDNIKNAPNLITLDISKNENINDLNPLESLKSLEILNLSGNKYGSFDVLMNLVNLTELDLSGTNFDAPAVLVNLKNLKSLNLDYCSFSNLKAIELPGSLEELSIKGNQIQDYTFLSKLKMLKTLTVGNMDGKTLQKLKEALPGVIINVERTSDNLEITDEY